jgi:hypothetical protein
MKVIHKAMRGGKTTELIAWLRESDSRKMVVMHAGERDRLIREYQLDRGVAQRIIIAAPDTLRGLQGEIAVDNAEWVLNQFFGRPVNIVSFTKDE